MALFAEDGTYARPAAPGSPIRGREAILDSFRSQPPRLTWHVFYNIRVDVDSPTRARASSDVILFTVEDGNLSPPAITKAMGSFDDVFDLVDNEWLFASRRGSMHSTVAV